MKASLTLGKVSNFIGLGFFTTLKDLFIGKLEKEEFKNFLRKTIVPLASILLFIRFNSLTLKLIKQKHELT
jgi:nitrate/nitrite transport system permease protein